MAAPEVLLSRMPTNEEFEQMQAYYAASEENMTFCGWVNKTKKKKSAEHRLLTIGQYRMSTWKEAKLGSTLKLAREGHLLDLASLDYLESSGHAAVNLKFRDFEFPFVETLSRGRHIVSLVKNFYVMARIGVPVSEYFGLYVNAGPDAPDDLAVFSTSAVGKGVPFAGFVEAYEAQCLLAGIHLGTSVVYREFLDLIVQAAGDKAIELVPSIVDDLEYLDTKSKPLFDLGPCMAALGRNSYFESFTLSCITRVDVFDALAGPLRTNTALTSLDISDLSGNSGFGAFGKALVSNAGSGLTSINMSGNAIKDKGISALAPGLATLSLKELNLSFCQFGAKGMSALAKAFTKSATIQASLQVLDLAGNKLGSSGTGSLADWLVKSEVKALTTLNLADTSLKVKKFSPILSVQVTPVMCHLDLSGNTFLDRDVVFLSNALMHSAVTQLDMSDSKISIDSLAGIVGCLITDRTRTRTVLDLSSIPLKPAGAIRLASSVSVGLNLHTLCLDDTALGAEGMIAVLEAIKQSARTLQELSLSRNVRSRDKANTDVVVRLVEMLSLPNLELTSLELLGSSKHNFGAELVPFLEAIGSNTTLKELNVVGNAFGDLGAQALGAALAANATLETVIVDNNGMTLEGLGTFAEGVSSNTSIVNLPIPDTEFKRIVLDNSGDTDAFDTMRNIIKTLRFAIRFNKTGRTLGWTAPPSLFGDNPDETDEEWLARDKAERRARRAKRREAKAQADAKRRTIDAGSHRSALHLSRAKKRETVSISDFQVEDFMEHIGSVGRGSGLAKAGSGGGGGGLVASAARNRADAGGGEGPSRPARPTQKPRPVLPPKPEHARTGSLSSLNFDSDYSDSEDTDDSAVHV